MKIKALLLTLIMSLCLCGCSAKKSEAAPSPTVDPMLSGQVFELPENEQEKASITFKIEGVSETVSAYVYEGMDYTIVVPDGGWHMYEPGAWQATFNQNVKFWVKGYSGDNAKKVVEQLSAEGYVLGLGNSVMTRTSGEDGLVENVMIFRNGDSLRAVFYCYPKEAAEGFGSRLDTIVNTFSWKDPQANATSGNMAGLTDTELQEALNSASIIVPEDGQSPQAAQIAMIISSAEEKAKALDEQLSKDVTQADMNITSAEIFTVWDDALNTIWGVLKESMSESDFNTLLNAQISWISQKEAAVQQAAAEYQGGSLAVLNANMKAAELTKERVYVLAEYLK